MVSSLEMAQTLLTGSEQVPLGRLVMTLFAAFLMWWTGYVIARNAIGSKADGLETLTIASVLMIALLIAQGLLLHILGGLNATGWLTSITILSFITMLCVGSTTNSTDQEKSLPPALGWRNAILLTAASCIAFMAVIQAREGALAHREFRFTEFWLLRDGGANIDQFVLGLSNHERETVSYAVDILLDGHLVDVWNGIAVDNGDSWLTTVTIPARLGPKSRIEAILYKNGDRETIYRRVWVDDSA